VYPELPAAYGTADVCTAALERLRDTGHTGFVAFEDGRALAVMTGIARETHARLFAEGCAVAPNLVDPTTLLARLYAALAPQLISARALLHVLDHVALPPLDTALANLGFGRHHVYATQPAAPRQILNVVQVRVGGNDDLDSIARLAQLEIQHRSTAPIYAPPDHRSLDEIRAKHRTLQDSGAIHLIATIEGRDVGLLTIEFTSPAPRLCAAGQPYIGPTSTEGDARGQGVGRALVAAALTLAHMHGHEWVSVDFESANFLSRPFWLGAGFRPIAYGVLRSIHPAHLPTV
jgi:GNAT superfamily N-acetyltransferase